MASKFVVSNMLLDLGCGTGNHDRYLKEWFNVVGIYISEPMLAIAREKNPEVEYHRYDMANFRIHDKFDVIVALFGVIHYNEDERRLRRAFNAAYEHLKGGGPFIFDVGFTTGDFRNHTEVTERREGGLELTLVDNACKVDSGHVESTLIFLIRRGKRLKIELDKHIQALLDVERTRPILKRMGFKVHLYDLGYTERKFIKKGKLIFVCLKIT
jgi:SAM-dependent methyltransferase